MIYTSSLLNCKYKSNNTCMDNDIALGPVTRKFNKSGRKSSFKGKLRLTKGCNTECS